MRLTPEEQEKFKAYWEAGVKYENMKDLLQYGPSYLRKVRVYLDLEPRIKMGPDPFTPEQKAIFKREWLRSMPYVRIAEAMGVEWYPHMEVRLRALRVRLGLEPRKQQGKGSKGIKVHVKPDIVKKLRALASARHVPLSTYVGIVLKTHVGG